MAFTQTTYSTTMAPGTAGMIHNMEEWNAISRSCETLAGIPFGVPVSQGAGDHGCILTAAAGAVLGISIRDVTTQANALAPTDFYLPPSSVGILKKGVIWVIADAAVSLGGAIVAANFNTATAKWTSATGAGIIAIPNATFDMSASGSGALVLVRIK